MTTIRQSRYLDGTMPGMRNPRVFDSEDRMYIQPDIETTEMGEGSLVEDDKKSICQRLDGEVNLGIADWFRNNRKPIITVLAIYGGYRLLRR
ncbi:hypothetical protein [Rhodohalobacter mucosus]|nr:hypothetical protein [Rhodohalobacter mucosus]